MRKPNVEKMERKRDIKGLVKALGHKDSNVRRGASIALGRIGSPAIKPLLEALKRVHGSLARQYGPKAGRDQAIECNLRTEARMICESLEAIGEPSVELLVETLETEDASIRVSVVEALGGIGVPRVVAPLIRATKESDFDVRYEAVRALIQIGGEEALEPLIQALENWDYQAMWLDLIRTLGEMENEKVVEPLIRALDIQDTDVRVRAVVALREIGGERVIEPLIHRLDDEQKPVRRHAARALGNLHARGFNVPMEMAEILQRVNWRLEWTEHQDMAQHDCTNHRDTPSGMQRVKDTVLRDIEW
jgi:HEAT repeat protein